ncbi:MAG: hypothetical protein LBT33_10410 [Spirochaetia bacterium]|nr:hypothetical protein [Spirochaetia bacterium]
MIGKNPAARPIRAPHLLYGEAHHAPPAGCGAEAAVFADDGLGGQKSGVALHVTWRIYIRQRAAAA